MITREGDYLYQHETTESGTESKVLYGTVSKVETIRIDDNTVADVSYQFDLTLGEYVETGRVTRTEPLPPETESAEQKIARLEADNAALNQQLAQVNGNFSGFVDQYYIDNPDKA